MAKAPRAKVPATSGQGVSRLSYQQGYALRSGNAPKVKNEPKGESLKREYGKGKSKPKAKGPGFNVSYGDTLRIGDLKDIEKVGKKGG